MSAFCACVKYADSGPNKLLSILLDLRLPPGLLRLLWGWQPGAWSRVPRSLTTELKFTELENLLFENYTVPPAEPAADADAAPAVVKVEVKVEGGMEGNVTSLRMTESVKEIVQGERDQAERPAIKQRMEIRSLPTRDYLAVTLTPILIKAVETVAKEKPPNPIEYIAAYLLKNQEQYKTDGQAEVAVREDGLVLFPDSDGRIDGSFP